MGILSSASLSCAQSCSNNEVSIGITSQSWGTFQNLENAWDHHLAEPALSITYTRNLSPSLAIEGVFQPTSQFFQTNDRVTESGHETVALGGVKAGWRGAKWSFYGKTQVGVVSWSSRADFNGQNAYVGSSPVTDFALEYGGIVERVLSGRYSLRFEGGHLLAVQFPLVDVKSRPFTFVSPGGTLQHLDLRFALARSFGAVHEAPPEHVPSAAKWDAGAAVALQPRSTSENLSLLFQVFPSSSLWASWNFSRHVSWDSALIYSGPIRFNGNVFSDVQSGGRSLEPLTGLKVGIRRDHMGYFAKVRGGTITFGETETRLTELPDGNLALSRGMFTNPVLDIGAIYEVYPSHRAILRFEAGSATIFYQPKTYFSTGEWISIPGQAQTGLLLSFGGGVRF